MHESIPQRAGFVLPWIILTVALLAILAAVVAPSVASVVDRRRALSSAATLRQIAAGFPLFEAAVHNSAAATSNNYPGEVSQLSIVVATAVDKNTCRAAMTAHDSTDWIAGGPFVPMYIPQSGLWTPIGRIRDSIPARTNPGGTQAIFVEIPGVTSADAALLAQVVDNGVGDTVTTVHAAVNDTTTVRYRVQSAAQVVKNRC